jgi:hypothetical protein
MDERYKKLIYLASPYSHKDKLIIDIRVRDAQKATAGLIEQGHLIYSPIVHSHPIAHLVTFQAVHDDSTDFTNTGSTWLDYDKAMVDKADEVWVLRLNGWGESRGIKAEVDHAHAQDKPVRYVDYPSLEIHG